MKKRRTVTAAASPAAHNTPESSALDRVRKRLGLPEKIELTQALSAIRRAIDQGLLLEAEVLGRFVLLNRPEQPDAWALRGEAALADGDSATARVFFHEALRCLDLLPAIQDTRRQRHRYWSAIAKANTQLNRREEAERAFLEAARYDTQAVTPAAPKDASALLARAYPLILQNQLDAAEPLLRAALEADAANAPAWQGLAVLEHKRGRHDQALAAIERALELNPQDAGLWNNRGVLLKPLGAPRLAERIAAYERAIALNPDFKEAYSNLADALISARRLEDAQAALERALRIDANYLNARINQANLLKAQGKKKEALSAIEAVCEQTRHSEALNIKGAILLELGEAFRAVPVLEEARSLDSRNASVLNNLGNAYLATAKPGKAIECYRSAVILAPGMAEAQANLALALLTQIEHGAPRGEYLALAKQHLKIAQELDSGLPQLYIAEGILKSRHDHDREAARLAYEKAIELQPQSPQALAGLASLYSDMGERQKARDYYQRAVALSPDDTDLVSNYIFALNYDPDATPQDIYEAACTYGRHLTERVGTPYQDWPNARDPNKRLKIGFVSGDFRRHPVAYFSVGLFEHLPRERVEVFAYHNHISSDDMTARIQKAVDHWRVIADMSPEAVCELIRADGIDVLIDLSGHTGYNRLDVFAKKPAPVQATWLGFVCSTGLPAMDFVIATETLLPTEHELYYTERIARLPAGFTLSTFDVCAPVNPISPPPSQRTGYITFGSYNNIVKANDRVFDAWAQILHKVPDSHLRLNYRQLQDKKVQANIVEKFKARDIAENRLEFTYYPSRAEALNAYCDIDIALDTFPYGGATTTCEALMMGVPVITMPSDRMASRLSSEYIHLLPGHERLVAASIEDYIAKAVALAHDGDALAVFRQQLRPAFNQYSGCHERFAEVFSNVLRECFTRGFVNPAG